MSTGFPQSTLGAGLDSVFQTAVITGGNYLGNQYVNGTYNYFYDAFGRRRAKTTPWSSTDEYFYDTGHQMLSDRGANIIGATPTEYPEDDYIWLGGRPLMFVRSKFAPSTWTRTADGPGSWCYRNSEAGFCGSYELVTDYLGKPVVVFDRGGTAGTSTYEALGYSNRREHRVGSPHYSAGSTTVATLTPVLPTGFDGPLRVLMSRSNYSTAASVTLAGVTQPALQGNKSHVWSDWQYAGGNSWSVVWNGTTSDYGFDMEAYEVRAKQMYVWWAWTPLRYPGQYFDAETELHENWNRYYDPSTGRYLSPEPLLQSPAYVRRMAQSGMSVPTYAYAANNPLRYTDPDGRDIFFFDNGSEAWDLGFDLECSESCEENPTVTRVSYGCGDNPLLCASWWANPSTTYSTDSLRGHSQFSNQVIRCEADCETTRRVFAEVQQFCRQPYIAFGVDRNGFGGHTCKEMVAQAFRSAGCSVPPALGPGSFMQPQTY